MNLLWETDALIAAMAGRPVGDLPEGVTGISIDTRTLEPGEAYFAIKGERLDGHDFLSGAMKAGVGLAVVAEAKLSALGAINLPLIVVTDVLDALCRLGMAARARCKAQIIAVTGSVGKTTTKEMLRTVLAASGKVHASAASYNNHWGVPLSLARMPTDCRFGVFEIGMNNPDEIRPLVKMVRPHIAAVTNVAAAHLGAFKNLDAIARAKAEIFEGVNPGGYGLVNGDDTRCKLLRELALKAGIEQVVTVGAKQGSDFFLTIISQDGEGSDISLAIASKTIEARINVAGSHMAQNAAMVLAIAILAGADTDISAGAIAEIKPEKGRGARHWLEKDGGKFLLIDESYNANPASMEAAIDALGRTQVSGGGRRIAVLGDMLELGEDSQELHRALSEVVEKHGVDLVVTAGKDMAELAEEVGKSNLVGHFADWKEAKPKLVKLLRDGDAVMLKASNGLRFADLVAALLEEFPCADSGSQPESGK